MKKYCHSVLFQDSGLSDWLGKQLTVLDVLPEPLLVIILGILVTIITQFTSNVASASLMLPIVAAMVIIFVYRFTG